MAATTTNGRDPGPASDPKPFKMKVVETQMFTENQPTCSRPISRPGIR